MTEFQWWLNFNSSTSGQSFIERWSYRITHTVACAIQKEAKLNSLFTARRLVGCRERSLHNVEASWMLWTFSSRHGGKLDAEIPSYTTCGVASHASCLGEREDRRHTRRVGVFLLAQAIWDPDIPPGHIPRIFPLPFYMVYDIPPPSTTTTIRQSTIKRSTVNLYKIDSG